MLIAREIPAGRVLLLHSHLGGAELVGVHRAARVLAASVMDWEFRGLHGECVPTYLCMFCVF